MKRVVVISDLHSGNRVGLTPPNWQTTNLQAEMWECYSEWAEELSPADALVINGDAIDGKGQLQGGIDLITSDREIQCQMAKEAIDKIDARTKHVVFGTRYHTGKGENWEKVLAGMIGADSAGGRLFLEVNGLNFDFKHFIGGSSVPYGRFTAVAKDKLWNTLWAQKDMQPDADVIIRSHVHYHIHCGTPEWLAIITPPLQGLGSEYGERIPSGVADFGLIHFDIWSKEEWSWEAHTKRCATQKAVVLSL